MFLLCWYVVSVVFWVVTTTVKSSSLVKQVNKVYIIRSKLYMLVPFEKLPGYRPIAFIICVRKTEQESGALTGLNSGTGALPGLNSATGALCGLNSETGLRLHGAGTGRCSLGAGTVKCFREAGTGACFGAGADTGASSGAGADTGVSSGAGADTGASSGAGVDTESSVTEQALWAATGGLDFRAASVLERATTRELDFGVAGGLDSGLALARTLLRHWKTPSLQLSPVVSGRFTGRW